MTEEAAYEFVEQALWPDGPLCPHCGMGGGHYRLNGKSTRIGLRKCRGCRKPFRITVGTIFESSHVPLSKWLQAIALIFSSKTGVTTDRIEALGVSRKSAWLMIRRIRTADLATISRLAKFSRVANSG